MAKPLFNRYGAGDFLQAVDVIDQRQQRSEENQLRLMQMESQLADQRAERELLPRRLEIDSKKLEYEHELQKADIRFKGIGLVDQMANSISMRANIASEIKAREELTPVQVAEYKSQTNARNTMLPHQIEGLRLTNELAQIQLGWAPLMAMLGAKEKIIYSKLIPLERGIAVMGAFGQHMATFQTTVKEQRGVANSATSDLARDLYWENDVGNTSVRYEFIGELYSNLGIGPASGDAKVNAEGALAGVSAYVNSRLQDQAGESREILDDNEYKEIVIDGRQAMIGNHLVELARGLATDPKAPETPKTVSRGFLASERSLYTALDGLGESQDFSWRQLKSLVFAKSEAGQQEWSDKVDAIAEELGMGANPETRDAVVESFRSKAETYKLSALDLVGLADIGGAGATSVVWNNNGNRDNAQASLDGFGDIIVQQNEVIPKNWREAAVAVKAVGEARGQAAAFAQLGMDISGLVQTIVSAYKDDGKELDEGVFDPMNYFGDIEDYTDPDDGIEISPENRDGLRAIRRSSQYIKVLVEGLADTTRSK